MAAVFRAGADENRRVAVSPKPKGRGAYQLLLSLYHGPRLTCVRSWGLTDAECLRSENAKDTLCRNVTIYGHCRYEDKGLDSRSWIASYDFDLACRMCFQP